MTSLLGYQGRDETLRSNLAGWFRGRFTSGFISREVTLEGIPPRRTHRIFTQEGTPNGGWSDLTTVGPRLNNVVCDRHGAIKVTWGADMLPDVPNNIPCMSFEVQDQETGEVVVPPSTSDGQSASGVDVRATITKVFLVEGLSPERKYQVTCKYRASGGGTARYQARFLVTE